jgi:hypothetical protein
MMPSERQLLAYDGVEGELAEEKRGFAGDVSTMLGFNSHMCTISMGIRPESNADHTLSKMQHLLMLQV